MPRMTTTFAGDFPATTAALGAIRDAVCAAARAAGAGDTLAADWVLAVNEACMNVIQHAYRFADGQFLRVEIGRDDDELFALVCDNGTPAALSDLQPRPLDELRPGGLGVHFIREVADTMAYLPPTTGWHNRLRIGRRLA